MKTNRASWSGGKGTSAEVPVITTSSPDYSGFNIPSAGALDSLRGDSWDCGCPDTRVIKKEKKNVLMKTNRGVKKKEGITKKNYMIINL